MKALQESTSWKPPDISTTHGVGEAESEDAASKLVVNPDGTVGGPGAQNEPKKDLPLTKHQAERKRLKEAEQITERIFNLFDTIENEEIDGVDASVLFEGMANAKSAVTKLSDHLNKASVKRVEALLEADTGLQVVAGNAVDVPEFPERDNSADPSSLAKILREGDVKKETLRNHHDMEIRMLRSFTNELAHKLSTGQAALKETKEALTQVWGDAVTCRPTSRYPQLRVSAVARHVRCVLLHTVARSIPLHADAYPLRVLSRCRHARTSRRRGACSRSLGSCATRPRCGNRYTSRYARPLRVMHETHTATRRGAHRYAP